MGMERIFNKTTANFDNMYQAPYRKNSSICNILQKTVISVDEDGTIAAAVTGIIDLNY